MVGWLALDDLKSEQAIRQVLQACHFPTPHWSADHQAHYVEKAIGMSSMQRFITPQCPAGLMPFRDGKTGCVINADVYLTNRERLAALLESVPETSDAELILQAYLKWGRQCTRHLTGLFCFMIWDPREQQIFAAVDPLAQCPIFFIHHPKHFFLIANECSPFHTLRPGLTINSRRLVEFAKDVHSLTETAYREIRKLPAGHYLVVSKKQFQLKRYWRLRDHRKKLPYQTRQEIYKAFQDHFENAVQRSLRGIGPLTTQLSGGLDSSAVTAQASLLLEKEKKGLTAFTILPNGLAGESFRPGWYYHEQPRIQTLLARYPNIRQLLYTAKPSTDIFEKLEPLQRCFDQPLRNINNLDWTMACYETVLAQQGRTLLIGAGGNGTISWAGNSPQTIWKRFYTVIRHKILRRGSNPSQNLHEAMASGQLTAPLRASVYPLQLWYGVRRIDPTQDLDLTIFCYNVPQEIYRRGNAPLEQRLLAREGLRHLLPREIAENPYRGEQGADWYQHYNAHSLRWRDQLQSLAPTAESHLWRSYDRQKILALFDAYPAIHQPPTRKTTQDLCIQLLRCLSVSHFLDATLETAHIARATRQQTLSADRSLRNKATRVAFDIIVNAASGFFD